MSQSTTDSYEQWQTSIDEDGVATVEHTNPASALTVTGLEELVTVLDSLSHDEAVEVILLRGGPRAFCVGMEIEEFVSMLDDTADDDLKRQQKIRAYIRTFHDSILAIRQAPQPVVAAVDGAAAGGGLSLVLATDYVIASQEATFTHAYTSIGATSDGGSTYMLPYLVGAQKAKELVFFSDSLSPEEMADLGLVNDVVDSGFDEVVSDRARELASRPSIAIAATKRLMNEAFDTSFEQHLESERSAFADMVTTETFDQSVRSFVGGRE